MKNLTTTFLFCLLFSLEIFGQLTRISNEIHYPLSRDNIRHSFTYKNQYAFVDGNYRGMLWLSDGTKEGTQIISTSANNQDKPVIIQNKIILVDYDWDNDKYDLYSVTENSRELLKENIQRVNRLIGSDSIAFFYNNNAIWRTNGTATGTYIIENLSPSPNILRFFIIDKYLHFNKDGNAYRNDGTNGSELIKAVNDNFQGFNPNGVSLNGIYYFSAISVQAGAELWRTDFTDIGTYMVKDLNTGGNSSPHNYQVIGNQIYFFTRKAQVWVTNGTEQGTRLVKQFDSEIFYSGYTYTGRDINLGLGNRYIFSLMTDSNGYELWSTDGTETGTQMIKDIFKGTGNSINVYSNNNSRQHNNYLYFKANNGIHGEEIWRTDGTSNGTELIYDLLLGMRSSKPSFLEIIDDDLYFTSIIPSADTTVLTLFKLGLNDLDNVIIPDYDYNIEWYRQIGGPPNSEHFNNIYSGEMSLDSKNAAYVTGKSSYPSRGVFIHGISTEIPYDTIIKSPFRPHVTKFDKDGDLEWTQYIGGDSYGLQEPVIAVDKEDKVIIGTSFWREGRFENVLVSTLSNCSSVIAKLDDSGSLEWLSEGHGARLELYDLVTDEIGNIYFTAGFRGTSMYWDEQFITTERKEGSSIIAKLSKSGHLEWMKELEGDINWSRGNIEISEEDIIVSLSEGDVNIQSPCEYNSWHFLLVKYHSNGTKKWSKLMTASDLTYISGMAISSNGDIMITGQFRGAFDFGEEVIESPQGEFCNNSVGFIARFNNNGSFVNAFQETENIIVPYQIITKGEDYYLVSIEYFDDDTSYEGYDNAPNNDKKIVIRKYDYLNNLQNIKSFNKTGSVRDDWFENSPMITFTSDGYTLLSDNIGGYIDTMPYYVPNIYRNLDMMLMKFKWEEAVPLKIFEDEMTLQLKLIPNPASSFTYIKILDEEFNQFDLTIYNMAGQQVHFEQKTDDFNYYRLDVRHFAAGTYVFHFDNSKGKQTMLKFIKM